MTTSSVFDFQFFWKITADKPIWQTLDGYTINYSQLGHLSSQITAQFHSTDNCSKRVFYVSAENHPDIIALMMQLSTHGVCLPFNPNCSLLELNQFANNLLPDVLILHNSQTNIQNLVTFCQQRSIPLIIFSIEDNQFVFSEKFPKKVKNITTANAIFNSGWLFHTSGSSGVVKGIFLSNDNIIHNANAFKNAMSISQTDTNLHNLPIFHVGGVVQSLITSFISGCTSIFWPVFSNTDFQELIRTYRPTWFTSAPSIHKIILKRFASQESTIDESINSFRFIRTSSAAMDPKTIQKMQYFYRRPILSGYGMTEAAGQISYQEISPSMVYENHENNVGYALGMEIRLLDANHLPIETTGVYGQISLRGKQVSDAFYVDQLPIQLTDEFGWYLTEDIGSWNEKHELILVGRENEIINRGGEMISTMEIRNVIMLHPDVTDCIVLPLHDELLGNEICAFVTSNSGINIPQLNHYLSNTISAQKIPSRWILLDKFPMLPNFKIDHLALFKTLDSHPKPLLLDKQHLKVIFSTIWSEVLNTDDRNQNDSIYDHGADSIKIIELALKLSDNYHITILPSDIFNHPSYPDLLAFIEVKLSC